MKHKLREPALQIKAAAYGFAVSAREASEVLVGTVHASTVLRLLVVGERIVHRFAR